MKIFLFAIVLSVGAMQSAHAANTTDEKSKTVTFQELVNMKQASIKQIAQAPSCDPKGAACYAENSWTCCSKTCLYSLCE
jgi:hypothetical protein